jgi:hypothetical protein
VIENESILELVWDIGRRGGRNDDNAGLSDSKINMTIRNILIEALYPLSQRARTTQNRHVVHRKGIWQGDAVLCDNLERQQQMWDILDLEQASGSGIT